MTARRPIATGDNDPAERPDSFGVENAERRRPALPQRLSRSMTAVALLACGCGGTTSDDGTTGMVAVAVAANFIDVHHELARRFEELTGHRAITSSASTGQLYAQIVNGAPFDVFLAADAERPRLLEEADLAVPGSRFTYAVGRLALYGPGLDSVRPDGADLVEGTYTHLAIANPATAPYGAAAEEVILAIGIGSVVRPRRFRARASRRRSSSSVPARPSCHPGLNQAAGRFTVSRLGQPDSLTPLPTPPGMSR